MLVRERGRGARRLRPQLSADVRGNRLQGNPIFWTPEHLYRPGPHGSRKRRRGSNAAATVVDSSGARVTSSARMTGPPPPGRASPIRRNLAGAEPRWPARLILTIDSVSMVHTRRTRSGRGKRCRIGTYQFDARSAVFRLEQSAGGLTADRAAMARQECFILRLSHRISSEARRFMPSYYQQENRASPAHRPFRGADARG